MLGVLTLLELIESSYDTFFLKRREEHPINRTDATTPIKGTKRLAQALTLVNIIRIPVFLLLQIK